MKKILKIVMLLALFAVDFAMADLPAIDRTDKVSSRRYLDSLNVYNRRPIRVNQSGFRPQDLHKYAYAADYSEGTTFKVIDANSGLSAYEGLLMPLGKAPKPGMYVNGSFNSITTEYKFQSGTIDTIVKPKNKNNPEEGVDTVYESSEKEMLFKADFSTLSLPGEYFIVIGKDTSATFFISDEIFNAIFENALKFYGIQRCGDTKSQLHGACHLKDGSAVGHDLTGGWHDCGDHFKVSKTIGYAGYVLSMVYLVYREKAEDRYGNSYDDTVFTDGIPDVLYEAKIGADFMFKLYKASVADGLIAKHDMYHSVGVDMADHLFWDVPEKQDFQDKSKGGPDRIVNKGIGTNDAGLYIATMANVAAGWKLYDAEYADSLLNAAIDIYKNVLKPNYSKGTTGLSSFYADGNSNYFDEAAAAAVALWYATGGTDTTYAYDLYKNTAINSNEANYKWNLPYFRAGYLGHQSGFYPGGWMTDYENVFSYVLFSMAKLILPNDTTAAKFGVKVDASMNERDTLYNRLVATFKRLTDDGTQGDSIVSVNDYGKFTVVPPYNLAWTSSDWGFNRYNLGAANAVFMLYDITKDEQYLKVALDNIYYNLGANPWDISFLMGAGDKNLNHPHNRSANPDGYNAGGLPYEYKCPRGALMGGAAPHKILLDDWSDYTATETCIDFSAQFLIPSQSLAKDLPPDNDGPLFSNIAGTPVSDTSAVISWDANEVALVTVFYNTVPNATGAKSVQQKKASKGGSVTIEGLEMGATYYFFLEGMDTKRNLTTDDNHGQWYQFTMVPTTTNISGVTICQVDNRSAKIYWWTDIRSNGVVNYGTSMRALNEAQSAGDGTVLFHEVELTNLLPGTTYYFTVSSGMSADDNNGAGYTFTTESEAAFANIQISVKPTPKNTNCSAWEDCNSFFVLVMNNDTTVYTDLELRLYTKTSTSCVSYMSNVLDGKGYPLGSGKVTCGTADSENGMYYVPITLNGDFYVSGSYQFELMFTNTYKDFEGSWSFIPHTDANDPEYFEGIDLTRGPLYSQLESSFIEMVNGKGERGYRKDPYIAAYYHGKHIYGYGPDYTPENGPQMRRTVALNFTSPFVSPQYSVEKDDYATTYAGTSTVSPTGFLDDLEMNGKPQSFEYSNAPRKDAISFSKSETLAYGNNYKEWVSWHNHGANKKTENKYDCACAVVRSNVEIDTFPPVKHYLVFDKTTYKTYQTVDGSTPKMVEVHVSMLDTLGQLDTAANNTLTLETSSGKAFFWDSPTSTVPITSIRLVNGEAVFYVSSTVVMLDTLYARTERTPLIFFEPAVAELIIEELPPWPIIDVAKMVDTDCDNVPDAFEIRMSNEYQPGQTFHSVQYTYNGDTLTTTEILSQSGKDIVVKANISDTTVNTNPNGSITLSTNVNGKVESHTDFYQDGIAPTLLTVSVLERLDTARSDRVYMQFSEPISTPGLEWPVQLFATDSMTKKDAPAVRFTRLYNEALNVWEFEIPFAADNSSLVTEGMFAQLLTESNIKDKSGNGISTTCGQPKLRISLKLLPVPITYASIADKDQDGVAEYIHIEYARAIDPKHYPDQISLVFGRSAPETLWVAGTVPSYAADSLSAELVLPKPFNYGITGGTYEGYLREREVLGAGQITQHLGEGASYEADSSLAEDLVGPVIVSAFIDGSRTSRFDILDLNLSEPVSVTDSSMAYYRQKQGERDTAVYRFSVPLLSLSADRMGMTVTYNKEEGLTVSDGDFVRLQPGKFSALFDERGNIPSLDAPWVPIMSSGKPQIKFNVSLLEEVATSRGMVRSQVPSTESMRLYVVNPSTHKLDMIRDGQVVLTGIDSSMIYGAVWRIEMTVPRGTPGGMPAAWDSLRIRYSLPIYSNLGNYVNRLSGKYDLPSDVYFSTTGKVVMFMEWANTDVGLQSDQGRAVATGAYIYKLEMNCKFIPNKNLEEETVQNFDSKDSYDKTGTFGVRRMR